MLDRGEKRELDRLSRDDHVHRPGALVEEEVGIRLQPREVGRRPRRRPELGRGDGLVGNDAPGAALEHPEARVRGDPVEPRAEGGLPPVGRARRPRTHERLLERVLRVLERAEHPVGVNLQLAAVALDQLRERSLVAGSRRADHLLLDRVRRRGRSFESWALM